MKTEEQIRKMEEILHREVDLLMRQGKAYKYAATERGYYLGIIGGGETFIPALCGMLFWLLPSTVKEMLRK